VEVLSHTQAFIKRSFDLCLSTAGLLLTWWIILIAYLAAALDTGRSGFFRQDRVGRHGHIFQIIKIRTMRSVEGIGTTVTSATDERITSLGSFLRRIKIDELPQLINVLLGQMSFVGPRPDVPGFADRLRGEDRIVLSVRPGITGPATLKYRNEEELLARQADPERFNREVIFPDKIRINREYVENYSFMLDIGYLWETLFPAKSIGKEKK
jgi:lipopolysaccharide/colanic/teichoic acid biosynthesis glycosyltransferase